MTEMAQPGVADEPAELPGRAAMVHSAAKVWTGELVDLTGRNTLLYYRDLKQGTLDLSGGSAARGEAVAALLASRRVRLSEIFADDVLAQMARRARTVKAKATENFEERGLLTLFLAWGMATWTNAKTAATPAAPILLRQAILSARGGAGEDFDLNLTDEWELNPTLLHLLKVDFGIDLNGGGLLDLLDQDAEPPNADALFERMAKECGEVPGFGTAPRVVIGNFSYAKLPMVLDLENGMDTLMASELICAIAGDEQARAAIRSRHPSTSPNLPDTVPPGQEFLVLDADASQSHAIAAATSGADLVIEGPPGTGKSQTIANLIATLAAQGKRVLFVAEKRAAIDAVLDRLRRAGLADLVLDLHDGAGAKRKLAADLARTLAQTATIARPELQVEHDRLSRHRGTLVDRNEALHGRRQPWDISVYDLYAQLPRIPSAARSGYRFPAEVLVRLDGQGFRTVRAELETFAALGGLALSEQTTPWAPFFAAGTISTADAAATALEVVRTLAGQSLPRTVDRLSRVIAECGLIEPGTVEQWLSTLTLLRDVEDCLEVLDPSVFETRLDDVAAGLAPAGAGALRRISAAVSNSGYRAARKSAMTLWKRGKPKTRDLQQAIEKARSVAVAWQRASVPGGLPHPPNDLAGTSDAFGQFYSELRVLAGLSGGTALLNSPVHALPDQLNAMLQDTETLFKLPELARCRGTLQQAGLWPLIEEMSGRGLTVDQALACADHVWLSSVLEAVSIADPRIGAFDGAIHDRTVSEFQAADRGHITNSPLRVRRAVAENITRARDFYPTESEVVEHQARLKRGHLPIRQLFQAAPNVLGALRPCWAMSPLVVSQLLPAQRCFDLVIFDEASQVTPADAIGALMRADRAVVAGDPHQLPPTNFFMASGGGDDDEDALREAEYLPAGTKNMESVLDVMAALLPVPKGTRTLQWHYRSRDERLIAFSNAQPSLYDWSLTTFPGAAGADCLSHVLVPYRPGRVGQEDSVSDEVAQVADLVAEHARFRPTESLGVIAMGIKHANRIEETLRRRRQSDSDLDRFLSGADLPAEEKFFVKNLERVQGDERDAIILTIGYGKNADGRMMYRFGPLNQEGGERRLNVAITRARSRMTVVSSFSAADMDPARLRAQGAKMLRDFLAYAESGGTNLGSVAKEKPELNPFERDVEAKLRSAGIPLIPQFGCSGYWIDFAAQHPVRRGQMVLAIECDGATYHSSQTARDRDRLRQEHLERLGWTFHRIWSQDWFFHHEREIGKAVAAYQRAVTAADREHPGAVTDKAPTPSSRGEAPPPPMTGARPTRTGPRPIDVRRQSIEEYWPGELDALIRWIESDTLLRTEDALLTEAMRELGFSRRGAKIKAALAESIRRVRSGS
ncbi:MAG: AAA domain-containing protein [Streptosporangiaceae bacterium]